MEKLKKQSKNLQKTPNPQKKQQLKKPPKSRLNLKPLKKLPNVNNPLLLIIIGIFIFIFGAVNYYRVRILSFSTVPPSINMIADEKALPVEVIIPSLKIDLLIDRGEIENGVWKISQNNATFLASSAYPGNSGNTVIYGHNKKAIFGSLPYISIGQKITVKTKDGNIYNYVVDKKYFVKPDRVDLVSGTDNEQLTLYTCWGLFDNQRAVIVAKPI